MPSGLAERYDFFLSRGGSVAAIAREVTDVLLEKGYKVRVEDYDFRLGTSFIEEMHEAITRSRDLIILFTEDYLRLPYTRKEFTSFEAQRLRSPEERHVAILRCEDAPLEGLLADVAYQDLVGVVEPMNASVASSLQPNVNRSQRHHHRGHDRSSVCHRGSRALQAALTNSLGLTPS